MKKIGIFYGTDSGNTRSVVERIAKQIGTDNVELHDIAKADKAKVLSFENLILATSTYGAGDLQADWEDIIDTFVPEDFAGKTIALVGLGDQESYGDTFCNGIFHLYEKAKGGKVIGHTSVEGYDFSDTEALDEDGKFVGLVIDEDNQDELTDERIIKWVKEITPLFS